MSELLPAGEPKRSKSLQYGALTTVTLYWAAKSPGVESAVPHIAGVTNTAIFSFTAMVGWQVARQAADGLRRWWNDHMQVIVRWNFSLGKLPKDRDSHDSDSS